MTTYEPELSWGHININVADLNSSIEFYQKLGFTMFIPGIPYLDLNAEGEASAIQAASAQALGVPAGVQARACIMQLDDGFPKIDLTEFTGETQRQPLTNIDLGVVRFCLASQDLAKDYTHLREQGVEFVSEPQSCKRRMADVAVCMDPDGTLIELLQVYLDRWPRLG